MRWGTRVNIWKTPTYLNGSKCVFCPSCQAGLPVTLATWKRGGNHFYNYLFSLKKLCLALILVVSQVKVLLPGLLSSLPVWILHVLPEPTLVSSSSSSSADGPGPQQSLFSSKMWFYSLTAQIIYLAFITHRFVVLVVFFRLCFPCA